MDFSPSPFWINKKQQTLVFNFSNVSNERCNEDDDDDENSEVLIGKHKKFSQKKLYKEFPQTVFINVLTKVLKLREKEATKAESMSTTFHSVSSKNLEKLW